MQSVSSAFTAVEKASFRQIAQKTQVSWHKDFILGGTTFTIGKSLIGGTDIIGIDSGAIGSPNNYRYFDDSNYIVSLGWERGLAMPQGGLTIGMAEAVYDNTSRRFTPRYMGGNSELFTAILPSRPAILSAGFNVAGSDTLVPQFAGLITEQPQVSQKSRQMSIKLQDYVYFFQSRYLENAAVFTGQRTDQILTTLLQQLGLSTNQYSLDTGLNIIPVASFEIGTKFADAIGRLVEAENGHFYQDETGIFRFENRQHWDNSPYTNVQKVITTSMVIDSQAPDQTHLINVVEVGGSPREKQANQLVWQITGYAGSTIPEVMAGSTLELWASFQDPMLAIDTPVSNGTSGQTSYFDTNDSQDGSGAQVSGVSIQSIQKFAQSCKIIFQNTNSKNAFITTLDIWGRPATRTGNVYYRSSRGLSVTAFQEQTLQVNNDFIQSQSWAETYGEMILKDFAFPDNIQVITILAIPELQLGDLISWQGCYFRIYDIKTQLDPAVGFIQQLTMIQKPINTYFRIGISTIGGSDQISP